MTTNFFTQWVDGTTPFRAAEMNAPIIQLDSAITALAQIVIIDRDLTAPPGSPSAGDTYIPDTSSTGAWADHDDEIAFYDGSAWRFFAPEEGWKAYVQDENTTVLWNGSSWASGSVESHTHVEADITDKPYLLGAYYNGTPGASEQILRHVPAIAFGLPSGLTGSKAKSAVATTAAYKIYLYQNGTKKGSINFASSATVATFTFASAATIAVGDNLAFVCAATVDASIAKIALTLKGSR